MLDPIIYILLIAGTGLGVWKGFQLVLKVCVYTLITIVGFAIAFVAFPHGAKIIYQLLPHMDLCNIIIFDIVIFTILAPGFFLARRLLKGAFKDVNLGWIDKFLGGLLGAFVVLVVIWFGLIGMMTVGKGVDMIATDKPSFAKTLVYPTGPIYNNKRTPQKFRDSYKQIFSQKKQN